MIDTELEVHQRFGDSGVNEEHSLLGETSDQAGGGARIEPEVSICGMVNYSWGKIVQGGGVRSPVDKLTVPAGLAGEFSWMLEKVMSSHDANGESQCLVSVQELHGLTEQVVDGRNPVSYVTKQRLGVEAIVFGEHRTCHFEAEFLRCEDYEVLLRIVDKSCSFDEYVGISTKGCPRDSICFFGAESSGLSYLEFLLPVTNTIKVVIAINTIGCYKSNQKI
jgi:hypothetical protein